MSYDPPPQRFHRWKRAKKIEAKAWEEAEIWQQVLFAVMDCETYAHMPPPSVKTLRAKRRELVDLARAWVGYPPEKKP